MSGYSVGQAVTVSRPGRDSRTGTVAHIHTAQGYVAVVDDRNRGVTTYPERFVSPAESGPNRAKRVYRRTVGDTVTYVSQRDGLAEIGEAQMARSGIRTMSQINRTDYAIDYVRGGEVRLELVDAPEEEPREWHATHTRPFSLHRFDESNRALCNKRIRANENPPVGGKGPWGVFKMTRSEVDLDAYSLCPKCAAK